MTKAESRVAFIISGFECPPEQISTVLDLEPTEVLVQGTPWGRLRKPLNESTWRLQAPRIQGEFLELDVEWLLDRLPPSLGALAGVTSVWDAQFAIATHISGGQGPSIAFSARSVARIAALQASIDIDIYCLS